MSDELKQQIDIELCQLHRLLETHQKILQKSSMSDPNVDELAALSAILHAFYNGIENIFKRVSIALDNVNHRGFSWHSELISSMSVSKPNRPALLSESLCLTLQEYLDFRHVFRHAYSFELRWMKMKHLVIGLKDVLINFERELGIFFENLNSKEV